MSLNRDREKHEQHDKKKSFLTTIKAKGMKVIDNLFKNEDADDESIASLDDELIANLLDGAKEDADQKLLTDLQKNEEQLKQKLHALEQKQQEIDDLQQEINKQNEDIYTFLKNEFTIIQEIEIQPADDEQKDAAQQIDLIGQKFIELVEELEKDKILITFEQQIRSIVVKHKNSEDITNDIQELGKSIEKMCPPGSKSTYNNIMRGILILLAIAAAAALIIAFPSFGIAGIAGVASSNISYGLGGLLVGGTSGYCLGKNFFKPSAAEKCDEINAAIDLNEKLNLR